MQTQGMAQLAQLVGPVELATVYLTRNVKWTFYALVIWDPHHKDRILGHRIEFTARAWRKGALGLLWWETIAEGRFEIPTASINEAIAFKRICRKFVKRKGELPLFQLMRRFFLKVPVGQLV